MDAVNIDLYIDAEEDTEAYCISAGIFRRLIQQNVHVRCYAYQMTAERFSDSMWTMQQVLFMSADRRLAIFLTDELAKNGGDELRMTHDQMAKYMGSAREVVSRMLKYFAQEGWVRLFRGGVQVLDKKKLQDLAGRQDAHLPGKEPVQGHVSAILRQQVGSQLPGPQQQDAHTAFQGAVDPCPLGVLHRTGVAAQQLLFLRGQLVPEGEGAGQALAVL